MAEKPKDDHAKSFSFLMDDSGVWTLDPAYGLTFSIRLKVTKVHPRLSVLCEKLCDHCGYDFYHNDHKVKHQVHKEKNTKILV